MAYRNNFLGLIGLVFSTTQNEHEMSQKDRKRHRQSDKFRRSMIGISNEFSGERK
jgi:hypothetical protein